MFPTPTSARPGSATIYVAIAVAVETVFQRARRRMINRCDDRAAMAMAAVILPWALPGVVNAVIWMWIYQPGAGLLNGILTAFGLPYDNHVWFNDRASAIVAVAIERPCPRMMPLTVVIALAALEHPRASLRSRPPSTARRGHRCSS